MTATIRADHTGSRDTAARWGHPATTTDSWHLSGALRRLLAIACACSLVALATTVAVVRPSPGALVGGSPSTWVETAGVASSFAATGPSFDLGGVAHLDLGAIIYGGDDARRGELVSISEGHARYRHGPTVVATYLRTPAGIEHGYELARPPVGSSATGVTIAQRATAPGLFPLVEADDVTWVDRSGAAVATYTGLLVTDADGRELSASLDADGGWLTFTIDTTHATWPVTVDPVLAVAPDASGKLLPPRSAAGDEFAHAIDVSGDLAVFGAASDDASRGAAYIFRRSGTTWTQVAKLTASDATPNDQFGHSVAIDGTTALIAAHLDDDGFASSGSVYVFTEDAGGSWTQQTKLHASDPSAGARFGHGLALSGDTAVVGADAGSAAYVFTRDPVAGTWSTGTRIDAASGSDNDNFGFDVALSGGTILVGAYFDDAGGANAGAAYVFVPDGVGGWTEQAKLIPASIGNGDSVGFGVDLDGDTAVLSAHLDDDEGPNAGAAYVFVRDGTGVWTEQAKLTASDATDEDRFGFSVAVAGDTLLVSGHLGDLDGTDAGAAYIFTRSGVTWTQQARIANPDPSEGDRFGRDVALDGTTAMLGAHWDDEGGKDAGAAYAFTGAATTWTLQQKLVPADPDSGAEAGRSVAVDGDTAIIGAPLEPEGGNQAGVAHVFTRSATGWERQGTLSPADVDPFDWFGFSVAVSGDTALISAHLDDDAGLDAGAVYVFARVGTTWTQAAKLTAGATAAASDRFGFDVALDGDTAVIGAPTRDVATTDAGSALVFRGSGDTWVVEGELLVPDAASGDDIGFSVAVSGDHAIVGAPLDDGAGTDAGTAYAFRRDGGTWLLDTELAPASASGGDNVGWDVAASGARALIGAPLDDDVANDAGAAYVFARETTWSEEAVLTAPAASARDHVGFAVALEAGTAVLGADLDDGLARNAGAAHVFSREDGLWGHRQRVEATSTGGTDRFGRAVALSGPVALIGAPGDDERGVDAGAAYVFDLVNADAGGPYEVTAGGSVPLDGTGSFATGLTAAWDLDGDLTFGETGADAGRGDEVGLVPTFVASGLTGSDVIEVTLRVSGEAGSVDDVTTVTVTATTPPPPPPPPGPGPAPAGGGNANAGTEMVAVVVTSTTGAPPTVTLSDAAGGTPPPGQELLPVTAEISAAGDGESPVTITFTVPTVALPRTLPGAELPLVTVIRDGVVVDPCVDAGALDPDPCISTRTLTPSGLTVEVLSSSGSDWTFGVAAGGCSVGVPSHGFVDLAGNVHAGSVACARWWELVKGSGDTSYSPGLDLTRGQLATVLVRLLDQFGVASPAGAPDAFTDDDGSVHEGAIDTLAALGIYRGRADGTSGVGAPIDRGQVASLLLGVLTEAGLSIPTAPSDAFSDDDGSVHEGSLDALAALGIYRGTGSDAAGHRATLRRDQAATLLVGALDHWYRS